MRHRLTAHTRKKRELETGDAHHIPTYIVDGKKEDAHHIPTYIVDGKKEDAPKITSHAILSPGKKSARIS